MESIEEELNWELEQFEKMFGSSAGILDHHDEVSSLHAPIKSKSDYFEMAVAHAEGEKDLLEDRLNELIAQSEVKDKLLMEAEFIIRELKQKNDELASENSKTSTENRISQPAVIDDVASILKESKAKIVQFQQDIESLKSKSQLLERDLSVERNKRVTAEKERDAYAGAYLSCIKHFEVWNQKKHRVSNIDH